MAISWPWNAPEHDRNHKMWTASEAKKIDFFSLGMSCLWILFEEELSAPPLFFKWEAYGDGHENPRSLPARSTELLHDYKIDRELPLLAQGLLEADENLTLDEKGALKRFFASVLDEDPRKREMSAGDLFKRYAASNRLEGAELKVSDLDFKVSSNKQTLSLS